MKVLVLGEERSNCLFFGLFFLWLLEMFFELFMESFEVFLVDFWRLSRLVMDLVLVWRFFGDLNWRMDLVLLSFFDCFRDLRPVPVSGLIKCCVIWYK